MRIKKQGQHLLITIDEEYENRPLSADYIISGDKDLLVLGKHNETRILDYNSFLSLL